MRLLVLSDLHHELWRELAPRIDPALSRPDAVIDELLPSFNMGLLPGP